MHEYHLLPPPRVSATMSKLEKIIADLKLADSKKEALQQAFETLKSNASSVASFTLQWPDLDAHFSSLRSSIQSRLEELLSQLHEIESNPTTLVNLFTHKQPNSICGQVSDILRSSSSPATLVLDTIPLLLKNGKGDFEESAVTDCVLLLEQLVQLVSIPSKKVGHEAREKARRLAVEWKEKMRVERVGEVMGFLDILGIYGLVGEFDSDNLMDFFEVVSVQDRAPELCRVLELEEKMPEFIQKLIMKRKQIQAIKFIYEFELVNLFPPVNLIKSHLRLNKKAVKRIRKMGEVFPEGQKVAANKELATLRAVVKCVTKYKLEAKIQLQCLHTWIGELETLNREEETTAAASDTTPCPTTSYPTTAPASAHASASKAQPQQQTRKPTPYLDPSSPTTAPASASKAQPQQRTGKPTPSRVSSPTIVPTSAPAYVPASTPASAPAYAPAPAPSYAPAPAPQYVPAPAPAYAPASVPAFAPTYAPAYASMAQPQQRTEKKRSAEELEAQSNQPSGNKRCQTAVSAGAAPKGPSQQHHLQQAGLLTGQAPPYLPGPPRFYASPGSAPFNPQMSSSTGQYGSTNLHHVNQYMMPPAQQYGSSIRPTSSSWSTGQFSFSTTSPGVAANPGGVGQFNLAGRPAGMVADTNPNWPPAPHHSHYHSSNVPFGHGYRPPATYAGGYGFPPQQRPP